MTTTSCGQEKGVISAVEQPTPQGRAVNEWESRLRIAVSAVTSVWYIEYSKYRLDYAQQPILATSSR